MSHGGAQRAAAATSMEVVWAPGMSEEETAYRIEYARWRHGGREGAQRRVDHDVLDGVKTPAEAAAEMEELEDRARYLERRVAAYDEERKAAARGKGSRRPRAVAR